MASKSLPPGIEKILNRTCSSELLPRIALIIGDWKVIGPFLSISTDTIDEIDEQEKNVRRKKIALLNTWKTREGEKATYLKLVQALQYLQRQDIIDNIIEMVKDVPIPPEDARQREIPKYDFEAISPDLAELKPAKQSDIDKLCHFAEEVQIILQTVNDKETSAVLSMMKGPHGNSSKPVNFDNISFKVVLGMFGGYKSAQIKTGMGRDCDKDVEKALEMFPNVHAIILIGVAYAAPRIKGAYGDVLVSKFIHGVQNTKTEDDHITVRPSSTSTVEVDKDLSAAFSFMPTTWESFICNKEIDTSKQRPAKVHCGSIVSYPNLFADKISRDALLENFREAIGGEMEGVEVLKIKQEYRGKRFGVIIIKGVADFGDSNKADGKKWQYTAAKSAASYAEHKLLRTEGKLFDEQ